MPRDKKKDKKKDKIPPAASFLGDSQPSTSQQQEQQQPFHDEDLGLTSGGRKKKKKTKKDRPVRIEEDVPTGSDVRKKGNQQSDTAKYQKAASKPVRELDSHKRKETNDGDDNGDGLQLGGGERDRHKKKKIDKIAPSTSASQTQPTQAEKQILSEGRLKSTKSPITWAQSRPAPPPESSMQPMHVSPQASTSQAQITGQSSGWGYATQGPSSSAPQSSASTSSMLPPAMSSKLKFIKIRKKKSLESEASTESKIDVTKSTQSQAPICLFEIPDKVLGRSVPCRHIRVIANYLEMNIMPIQIHRYDISFDPDKPKKFISTAYNNTVTEHFANIPMAFDQRKNVFCLKALPGVPTNDRLKFDTIITDSYDKPIKIEVSFKFTGVVDLNTIITYMKSGGTSLNPPTEAIQAVDVILRQGTLESYVKVGRQFFKRPSKPIHLGEGLEIWTGLFQSAIFTSRPFVNIDVTHKGFPKHQLLIDAYTRDFRLDTSKTVSDQCGRNVEAFLEFLKGLKVVAYIGGDLEKGPQREFTCNGLVEPPRRMFFKIKQGTPEEANYNVRDYFEKVKNSRIRYPDVNCVWVGPAEKRIYYPMEFLQVASGQVCNKQMNEQQLSILVKESATPPHDRKKKIEEVIADMNYSKKEYFKEFGLDISTQFINIDAKVLHPPKIDIGGASVEPRRGVWQSKRLLKPQSLESWGMISVDTDPRNSFDNVINMIMGVGNDMGMHVKSPQMVSFNISITDLSRTIRMVKDKGIGFLFVIISSRRKDCYHKLKRITEREVGLLTQCIKEFTASRKMNEQTVRNIMLKVNSKLMGINHALDIRSIPSCLQQGKIMLVGADVTHPSPDQSFLPSIAAVTASIDHKFTIYNITMSVQAPKKEVIVDFENMMVEHFAEFEKRQKGLPSKIYVFRDGVSEGQFAQVMNSELQAIHNAYKRRTVSGSTKRPEVLFLLVQKRHHTRLFMGDSAYNVEPGTVVDNQIVHAKELDFYLVSHHAMKGTVRPTRYHAVCNDGRIAQEEVEQLTYYLCHLYARCTRAVSYPTPTYYAHLACMRARSLTFGDKFCNADLEKSPQRLRIMENILEISRMFFI